MNSPMIEAMEPVAHTVSYDGRVMLRGSMNGTPLPAEWRDSVTVPTLVMDGGDSPAWMRNAAQAVADLLPNARRQTLEGCTHAAPPERVAAALIDFFGGDR